MMLTETKSDRQIKEEVLNELRWDSRVEETEIGVQVRSGVVTLTGRVSCYPKRIAAREAAHRVRGVHDVVDDIHVTLASSWQRTDEDLADSIRQTLRNDVLVPEERITSTVTSGYVTLQGSVDTWTERLDAENAVQRIVGVRGVLNQITIEPRPVDPGQITQQIAQALERQAEHDARRVRVRVHDGVVTLTGTVRSWVERGAIEHAAGHAPGVRQVDDQTEVDPCV